MRKSSTPKASKSRNLAPVKDKAPKGPGIAEFAYRALDASKEPVHVKDLVQAMQALGWDASRYANPKHVVYTTLFGLIQRQGETCGFRFAGQSRFTTKERVEVDPSIQLAEVKPAPIKKNADGEEIVPQRRKLQLPVESKIPEDARKCGNCKHLVFEGINAVTHRQGVCERWEGSGRVATYPNSPQCDTGCWEEVPAWQREKAKREQRTLMVELTSRNVSFLRSARRS